MGLRTMVFLMLALSCFLHRQAAEIVHSASLGFVQSILDPKYKIEFHSVGSPIQKDPDQEAILMTGLEGRKYECVLPKSPDQQNLENDVGQQNNSIINLQTERRNKKSPNDLLDSLKDKCFLMHEGWWTYEFCYYGRLRQLHLENKKVVEEYILGVYDSEATAALHRDSSDVSLQKDLRSRSAGQRYHVHIYKNGTSCDITNEKRETEVRFVCADTGKALINSITEGPTCKYKLIFHAPMLCKHPLFQEERPQLQVINCFELPSVTENASAEEENDTDTTGLLPAADDLAEVVESQQLVL